MRRFGWLMLWFALALGSAAGANVNWNDRGGLRAGRVSLENDGYRVEQTLLDLVRFSPEFQQPLRLIYDSERDRTGLVGRNWQLPLLESRISGSRRCSARYSGTPGVSRIGPFPRAMILTIIGSGPRLFRRRCILSRSFASSNCRKVLAIRKLFRFVSLETSRK